jgi:hypothetical protein
VASNFRDTDRRPTVSTLMQRVILRPSRPLLTQLNACALRSYASAPVSKPTHGPTKPYQHNKAAPPEQSWLTRKLKQSPTAMRAFLKVFGALGYGSSRQVAARRALALYDQLCAGRAEEDRGFWAEGAHARTPLFFIRTQVTSFVLSFFLFSGRQSAISLRRSSPGSP